MTNEQLIAKARECVSMWEKRAETPIDWAILSKVHVREAVVVNFEGEQRFPSIQVILDKDTGETISSTHFKAPRQDGRTVK
jgi:hypothetical protein